MSLFYAAGSDQCPQRHWGSDVSRGYALRVNNNDYRFSNYRHERVNGLLVLCDVNKWDGTAPQSQIRFFFPWESLNDVTVSIKGVRLP